MRSDQSVYEIMWSWQRAGQDILPLIKIYCNYSECYIAFQVVYNTWKQIPIFLSGDDRTLKENGKWSYCNLDYGSMYKSCGKFFFPSIEHSVAPVTLETFIALILRNISQCEILERQI